MIFVSFVRWVCISIAIIGAIMSVITDPASAIQFGAISMAFSMVSLALTAAIAISPKPTVIGGVKISG